MGEAVNAYLDFALKPKGIERHRFIREMFALAQQMSPELFLKTIERALRYRIDEVEVLPPIAVLLMNQGDSVLPPVDVDENFRQRDAYREGHVTEAPDLSAYDKMLEDNDG
jgi:hypothetical protein